MSHSSGHEHLELRFLLVHLYLITCSFFGLQVIAFVARFSVICILIVQKNWKRAESSFSLFSLHFSLERNTTHNLRASSRVASELRAHVYFAFSFLGTTRSLISPTLPKAFRKGYSRQNDDCAIMEVNNNNKHLMSTPFQP